MSAFLLGWFPLGINYIWGFTMRVGIWTVFAAVCLAFGGQATGTASATTPKPIYNFCSKQDCTDGNSPVTLAMDAQGNLYGTTMAGGDFGNGAVFSLIHNAARTTWTYHVLYSFCQDFSACPDGREPGGTLVLGTDGSIYGTTTAGGNAVNSGVVFALTPNTNHTKYTYSTIYTFCTGSRCTDGSEPSGGLTFSSAQTGVLFDKKSKASLFGVTASGGANNSGVAYELTPAHKGKWKYKDIHDFCQGRCTDGGTPLGKLLFTSPTTVAGVTLGGGGPTFGGAVYSLISNAKGTIWKSKNLFSFDGDSPSSTGDGASDGVIMGADGSFYGTTTNGSPNLRGVLYKLTPNGKAYKETILYAFCQQGNPNCIDGSVPGGMVPAMDTSGNLYGTTTTGGANEGEFGSRAGTVWKFDGTNHTVLYSFCSQANCTDGDVPQGVIMDGSGNLFGVTSNGGANRAGLVYEMTP